MYAWAALRNVNRSICKAFITAIQDTLLAPDFVQKNSCYNTVFRISTLLPSSDSNYLVVLVEWAAFRSRMFLNVINHHPNATHMNKLSNSHQTFCVDLKYLVLWMNFAAVLNCCMLTDKQEYSHVEDIRTIFGNVCWNFFLKYTSLYEIFGPLPFHSHHNFV